MAEGLRHLVSLSRPPTEILRDLLDILVVTFIVYRALLVLRGTRAMQMGLGFMAFGLLYLLAKYAELATLMSVLSWLASSAILIVVVVFQNDIRRALIRLGSKALLSRGRAAQERIVDEVVAAATELARHRMGAIICLERDANVLEFVSNDGLHLDSMVTRELLVSLFIPEAVNKTHDGAVLIRDYRIARAGVFFPMPDSEKVIDPAMGSRHRAAIGITEETDAVVVAVSEERGTITLFFGNHYVQNVDATALRDTLLALVGGVPEAAPTRLLDRMTAPMRRRHRRASREPPRSGAPPSSERTARAKTAERGASASGKHPTQRTAVGVNEGPAADTPPPPVRPPSAGKSGRHQVAKGRSTSRSGRFTPIKREDNSTEAHSTSSPPRVSVPMPTADERASAEAAANDTDARATPAPESVSKPMKPTELPSNPGSASLGGEDS